MNEYQRYEDQQLILAREEQRTQDDAKRHVTQEEIEIERKHADARQVRAFGIMLSKLNYPDLKHFKAADFMIEIMLALDELAMKCARYKP